MKNNPAESQARFAKKPRRTLTSVAMPPHYVKCALLGKVTALAHVVQCERSVNIFYRDIFHLMKAVIETTHLLLRPWEEIEG